jgi:plasmid stabilization system protein ParE
MDYQIIVRPEAKADILDAFNWYQQQRPGLGYDFKLCIDEVMSKLEKNPLIFKKTYRDIRRAFIKRFPFGIFYLITDNRVIVLSVMHARRDPSNWKTRI